MALRRRKDASGQSENGATPEPQASAPPVEVPAANPFADTGAHEGALALPPLQGALPSPEEIVGSKEAVGKMLWHLTFGDEQPGPEADGAHEAGDRADGTDPAAADAYSAGTDEPSAGADDDAAAS